MNRLEVIQADSMPAALAEVRRRLGAEAVILHTRSYKRSGALGLGAKPVVEITAAKNISDLPTSLRPAKVTSRMDAYPHVERAEGTASDMLAAPHPSSVDTHQHLVAEIGELKGLVHGLVRRHRASAGVAAAHGGDMPEALHDAYLHLVEREVAEETASQLTAQVREELGEDDLRDPRRVRAALSRHIAAMVPAGGEIVLRCGGNSRVGPKVVTLVGPTGVGKTTTVAKLAAEYALRRKARVALITVDTYRIAAVEQLRTYARIIGVPLRVANSPESFREALDACRDFDLVLIDTAGRSPRDDVGIAELKTLIAEVTAGEVHLVLAATSSRKVLDAAIEKFAPLNIDRLVFTKLDEAVGCGVMLSCLEKVDAQLSYVTTGQNVPQDIEVASQRRIAQELLGAASVLGTVGAVGAGGRA